MALLKPEGPPGEGPIFFYLFLAPAGDIQPELIAYGHYFRVGAFIHDEK